VKLYLDTSVLVAILIRDLFTERAYRYLNTETPSLIVSDYAAAEFASAVARRVRMGEITGEAARATFATFDGLAPRTVARIETSPADIKAAEGFLRRLDLTLRAPDAVNIAIARRIGAILMTFDDKMAASAKILGVDIAPA
jgi:predicted nucleic acid-binding protein